MTGEAEPDDLVPVSVRLGEVVPPEDPEDWTRPLTWVAALGMLAGPLSAVTWFLAAPPAGSEAATPATYLVAGLLAAGASATGATQLGFARAWTATLGAALFGCLVTIMLGVVLAGERQVGVASPTLAHAFVAGVGGLGGAAGGAVVAAVMAGRGSRLVRFMPTAAIAVVLAFAVVLLLMGAA